jgi:hypothetical protein
MASVTNYEYPRIDEARKAYYIRLAQDDGARELVHEILVPRLGGKAFIVAKDHILRMYWRLATDEDHRERASLTHKFAGCRGARRDEPTRSGRHGDGVGA